MGQERNIREGVSAYGRKKKIDSVPKPSDLHNPVQRVSVLWVVTLDCLRY